MFFSPFYINDRAKYQWNDQFGTKRKKEKLPKPKICVLMCRSCIWIRVKVLWTFDAINPANLCLVSTFVFCHFDVQPQVSYFVYVRVCVFGVWCNALCNVQLVCTQHEVRLSLMAWQILKLLNDGNHTHFINEVLLWMKCIEMIFQIIVYIGIRNGTNFKHWNQNKWG